MKFCSILAFHSLNYLKLVTFCLLQQVMGPADSKQICDRRRVKTIVKRKRFAAESKARVALAYESRAMDVLPHHAQGHSVCDMSMTVQALI